MKNLVNHKPNYDLHSFLQLSFVKFAQGTIYILFCKRLKIVIIVFKLVLTPEK